MILKDNMNRLLLKENLATIMLRINVYTYSSFVALIFFACRSRKNDHLLKAYFFVQKLGV